MTTASSSPRPGPVTAGTLGAVVPAALVTAAAGGLAVTAGALVGGAAAALAAAVGAVTVVAAYLFGTATVAVVARAVPAMSLVLALLTYGLQVALVTAVFAALHRGGALGGSVHPGWLAGTVIGCTAVWTLAQIRFSTRARHLAYELPAGRAEASVR